MCVAEHCNLIQFNFLFILCVLSLTVSLHSLSLSCCNLLGVLCVSLAELDTEHAQKVLEMEHAQQVKLKERQKYFEEAFQQDMEQYLSTGYLQITDRRGQLLILYTRLHIPLNV